VIEEKLSASVIGLCLKIHKTLGSGLLESTYHQCLAYELTKNGIAFQSEVMMPVRYENLHIESGYRADLIIENKIIIELKSVEKITDIHKSQILTYLKMSGLEIGLLINFKEPLLKNGLHRFVNSAHSESTSRPPRDEIMIGINHA
jgi:GxxExxY protein